MKLQKVAGTTSQTINIFVQDSSATDGSGLTGLVYNTANLVCWYVRPGVAEVQITLATQTVTGAWATGGFVEIDATNMPGVYRLDLPNAVLAAGVDHVVVMIHGASDMAPLPLEIQLTAFDLDSADVALDEDAIATAILDLANGVESGLTLRQCQRALVSVLAGLLDGAGTTTVTTRDTNDTKDRVTATINGTNDRTVIVLDLT